MNKIINNIKFWYNNSRPYSAPITFLTWLVACTYSFKHGGDVLLGIIAYIGIALVHLTTNLCDDYFDYIRLKDKNAINSTKKIKFKYLKDNTATISDLRNVILILFAISSFIGLILFVTSGFYVGIFAIIALIIAIMYSFLSSKGLGDIAVIIAYGPLLFEGVYYVMTKSLSLNVLLLALVCGFFVNTILYAHMLMDFDDDISARKKTLCTNLRTKNNALCFLMFFYLTGYILIGILSEIENNKLYLLTYLTMPMTLDLYNSLKIYNSDKTTIPKVFPWHYPLDNWDVTKYNPNATFFFRFFYARNISTWFMLLTCYAILFS